MFAHLKAVWTFRYFWMSLVKMDLRSRYRRSFLGIGWSVLHPIAMSAVFCLVFAEIMRVQGGDPSGYPAQWRWYAAYLVTGLAVWEFIRNSTASGCQALLVNEAYIRQCPLPYGIYPLRTVMGTAIHFVISTAVEPPCPSIPVRRSARDCFRQFFAIARSNDMSSPHYCSRRCFQAPNKPLERSGMIRSRDSDRASAGRSAPIRWA